MDKNGTEWVIGITIGLLISIFAILVIIMTKGW